MTDAPSLFETEINGATDGTGIGNVGDRLKVDIVQNAPVAGVFMNAWKNTMRYDDMNVANGGVARETEGTTSYMNLYSISGKGYIVAWTVNIDYTQDWQVDFIVDGATIFSVSCADLVADRVYDLDTNHKSDVTGLGLFKGDKDNIFWRGPLDYPMYYATSILIKVKRLNASPSGKKFGGGLICLTKD